jgi:hypothetical protein
MGSTAHEGDLLTHAAHAERRSAWLRRMQAQTDEAAEKKALGKAEAAEGASCGGAGRCLSCPTL